MKFIPYRLEQLCHLQIGKTPKRNKKEYWGEGFPWVSIADMKGKFIESTKEQITQAAIKECGCKVVHKNSLLMSFKLSIGKLSFASFDLYTNEAIVALIILDYKKVYPEYLYYALKGMSLAGKNTGAKGSTLNTKSLKKISIPIPELFEDQIRIATLFKKIDLIYEQRESTEYLLDKYLLSAFQKVIGNPFDNSSKQKFTTLEKICTDIIDCPHSTPNKIDSTTQYPCIRTTEIKNGYIEWKTMQYLDKGEYTKRIKRFTPKSGDIVYGREGSYGDAVRIPIEIDFSLGQRTVLFRPDYQKCNSDFLWAMVRSQYVYNQAKKKNNGSTVGHVNVRDIRQFKILLPDIKKQEKFSSIVKHVDQIKDHLVRSKTELKNLQSTIFHQVFKLKVNLSLLDISDELILNQKAVESGPKPIIDTKEVKVSRTTTVGKVTLANYFAEDFANLIKTRFSGLHFRFIDIIEMFKDEGGAIIYFSTQELKGTKQKGIQDIQTFIFECIESKNKNLKLTQTYYDALSDLDLKKINLHAGNKLVLEQINNNTISREELSGIYFQIAE